MPKIGQNNNLSCINHSPILDNPQFLTDANGFLRQHNPRPFEYDLTYKARQSTNPSMAWLRLGWLAAHIPYDVMSGFTAVDIGAGNGTFVAEASKVFKRCAPYDLRGDSITDKELYHTDWDLIVMSDVLEHYHDINDLWSLSFEWGMISFPETPQDYPLESWRHYKPNEHIYCMTAAAFAVWVGKHGYKVVAAGCPEDMIRRRWDDSRVNISTFLIRRIRG